MTSGIYCIKNKVNGKMYIGSSVNIEDRWRHHKSELRNSRHSNIHLQRAFDSYGENNFYFEILEETFLKNMEEKEDFYIEKYKTTDENFGYNKKWGFGRSKKKSVNKINRPMLEETKEKISKRLKGRKKSEEWKAKMKKPKSESFKKIASEKHLFKKLNVKSSSNFVGVYFMKKINKWASFITVKRRKVHLGVFEKEIDAAVRFDTEYKLLYNKSEGINFK